MTKLGALFLILLSVQSVFAVYPPREQNRPHTVCWNSDNELPGLMIYLTDFPGTPLTTRLDIYERDVKGPNLLETKDSSAYLDEKSSRYKGTGVSLVIQAAELGTTSQKSAHLELTLENGKQISREMTCDTLMYPMTVN